MIKCLNQDGSYQWEGNNNGGCTLQEMSCVTYRFLLNHFKLIIINCVRVQVHSLSNILVLCYYLNPI